MCETNGKEIPADTNHFWTVLGAKGYAMSPARAEPEEFEITYDTTCDPIRLTLTSINSKEKEKSIIKIENGLFYKRKSNNISNDFPTNFNTYDGGTVLIYKRASK